MAKAYKCDNCGTYFTEGCILRETYHKEGMSLVSGDVDLCQECVDTIKEALTKRGQK